MQAGLTNEQLQSNCATEQPFHSKYRFTLPTCKKEQKVFLVTAKLYSMSYPQPVTFHPELSASDQTITWSQLITKFPI